MTPKFFHQRWTPELLRNLHHSDPHDTGVRSYSSRWSLAVQVLCLT